MSNHSSLFIGELTLNRGKKRSRGPYIGDRVEVNVKDIKSKVFYCSIMFIKKKKLTGNAELDDGPLKSNCIFYFVLVKVNSTITSV